MKILAVSHGDSTKKTTWSGVPYSFLAAIEDHLGSKSIVRLNMEEAIPSCFVATRKLFDRFSGRLRGPLCSFDRTLLYGFLVNRLIKNTVIRTPEISHILIFDLSTDVHSYPNIKLCRLGDWTIEHAIQMNQHRKPSRAERMYIDKQYQVLNRSDFVVSLFPQARNEMIEHGVNAFYLGNGSNVPINDLPADRDPFSQKYILFIGSSKYKSGLDSLVAALRQLPQERRPSLHVIGMTSECDSTDDFVFYHGYLSKENKIEKEQYYSLLCNSLAICNTTEGWGGAQSILEGMTVGSPVIVGNNPTIKSMFGNSIDFGWYCGNDPTEIASCLISLMDLNKEDYAALRIRASEAAKNFTWDRVAKRWLRLVD